MKRLPEDVVISTCLCECNLCSPHKMPCYNHHLEDEILTIDKLSLSNGNKTATVGVEEFCNSLLRISSGDFYHDSIKFFKDNPTLFDETKPNLFKNKKLLSVLKELKAKKEAELLRRGQGVYINPYTGEVISRNCAAEYDGRGREPARCKGFGRSRRSSSLQTDEERKQEQQDGSKRVQRLQSK